MALPSGRNVEKKSSDLLPEQTASEKSEAWTEHEHVAAPIQTHAQKLIHTAGSPGLAKQAIDAAQKHPPARASAQDEFARRWGFRSYLELFESSTTVRTAAGKNWRVTAIPGGGWIAWNETDLYSDTTYATRDEAMSHVPSNDAV